MNHLKFSLILFFLLAGITISFYYWIIPYQIVGESSLGGNWQIQPVKGQAARYTDDLLYLSNLKKDATVRIFQDISGFEPGNKLRLSARIKVQNVVPGEKPWNRARLLLVQYDGKKDRWDLPHQAAALEGTADWEEYQLVTRVAHDTKKIWIRAELGKCTGRMSVKDIRLNRVVHAPGYVRAQKIILSAWSIYLLFYLAGFLDRSKATWLSSAMIVVFAALIIIGTTIPGKTKMMVSKQISHQIEEAAGEAPFGLASFLPKAGHFIFFLLFGGGLCAIRKEIGTGRILCYILILAGGTEFAQLFIEGRTPLFSDFLIDISGGIFGMAVYSLFTITVQKFFFPKRIN